MLITVENEPVQTIQMKQNPVYDTASLHQPSTVDTDVIRQQPNVRCKVSTKPGGNQTIYYENIGLVPKSNEYDIVQL